MLAELSSRPAEESDRAAATAVVDSAAARMGRTMESADLRDLLADNLEHPRWDEVAERCLTCGNCTMVCPPASARRSRTRRPRRCRDRAHPRLGVVLLADYSYIHGGASAPRLFALPAVDDAQARHLARPVRHVGCVGCGRCITWCPVGIDITEEVAAIRGEEGEDATTA